MLAAPVPTKGGAATGASNPAAAWVVPGAGASSAAAAGSAAALMGAAFGQEDPGMLANKPIFCFSAAKKTMQVDQKSTWKRGTRTGGKDKHVGKSI